MAHLRLLRKALLRKKLKKFRRSLKLKALRLLLSNFTHNSIKMIFRAGLHRGPAFCVIK